MGLLGIFSSDGTGKVSTPGVVWGRWFRGSDLPIEGFGIDDFGLADGLVEDGEG